MGIISLDPRPFLHSNCIDFNGTNENMKNTTNMNLGFAATFSISLWVKHIIQGTTDTLFHVKPSGTNFSQILITCSSTTGNLSVSLSNNAGTVFKLYVFNNFYSAGTWTNLIFTWDGTTLNVYKNGILQVADTLTTDNAGVMTNVTRGVAFGSTVAGANFANCRIHSCAIWSAILTAAEVKLVGGGYDGSRLDCRAIQPDSLMHWWLLGWPGNIGIDMGFGITNVDVNTNAANITVFDDVVGDAPVSNIREQFYGHVNALDFDGVTECVRQTGLCNFNMINEWTVAFWLKPMESTFASQRTVCMIGNGTNGIQFLHQGATANDPWQVLIQNTAGSTFKSYTWNNLINGTQSWQHIIATWDGTTLLLYSNGSVVAPTAMGTDNAGTQANVFRVMSVGASIAGANPWLGRMHSVTTWSRAITASEASIAYNSGNPRAFNLKMNINGITHWYLFGTDETVTDYMDSSMSPMDLTLNQIGITLVDDRVVDYPGT